MSLAISIENLSKSYRLGQIGGATIREDFARWWARKLGRPDPYLKIGDEHKQRLSDGFFWALRDVSFQVGEGDVVGIIGRNGAGKSTLLKILSRVTGPSEGCVKLRGRVASLLEVGTGFHPELTGRENTFLNGAILGMSKAEIRRKFDEIVAFAELEEFIDTPVKRYSSGMYVRLAFAVAAHLEPEILIIDEVLAVGDAAFQKKCLGKMSDVARGGRTVLFVSHNMAAVCNLCSRGVVLNEGRCVFDGPATAAVDKYMDIGREQPGEKVWKDVSDSPGDDKVRLTAVRIVSDGEVNANVDISSEVTIEIEFENLVDGARIWSSLHLLDKIGIEVLASANFDSANLIKDSWYGKPHPVGRYRTVCTIPGNFLNDGNYSVNVFILTDPMQFHVFERDVISFHVYDTGEMRKEYQGHWLGVVRPRLAWSTEQLSLRNCERNVRV